MKGKPGKWTGIKAAIASGVSPDLVGRIAPSFGYFEAD
jgi:hypothetical protein